jgi:hypothetical protein
MTPAHTGSASAETFPKTRTYLLDAEGIIGLRDTGMPERGHGGRGQVSGKVKKRG